MHEAALFARTALLALLILCALCMVPDLIRWYRAFWKPFVDRW